MLTMDDLEIGNFGDFLKFLPIVIFMGLCAPFLIAAYSLSTVLSVVGLLD